MTGGQWFALSLIAAGFVGIVIVDILRHLLTKQETAYDKRSKERLMREISRYGAKEKEIPPARRNCEGDSHA